MTGWRATGELSRTANEAFVVAGAIVVWLNLLADQ
jgi:hypothetical protein